MRKKKITETPLVLQANQEMRKNAKDSLLRKNWEYFSGRVAVDFVQDGEENSGNVSLRMRKDSLIWFSASASIGIQVAKGIVTRDSIIFLDLIHRTYSKYSIRSLGKTFGTEITLRHLQNILIGNPVFDTLVYSSDPKGKAWYGIEHPLTNVFFAPYFKSADSSFLVQKGSEKQLRTVYSGTKSAGSYSVADKMRLTAFGDSKTIRIDMQFTTASDEFIPSYPFVIPSGYKSSDEE